VSEIIADVYVRISKVKHRGRRKTLGVERQEPPCLAFIEEQGWRYRKTWTDNGVSAVKAKRREQFEAMLADVRAGNVNAIVSWQPDRLLRTVEDASAIVAIAREFSTTIANVGGTLDLSTAAGRKKFYDLAVAAQYESDLRGERLQLKHDELGQAGAWWGGKWRPFGFQKQPVKRHDDEDPDCTRTDDDPCPWGYILVPDTVETQAIHDQAVAIVEKGATPSGIAAAWNRAGMVRPGGGRWLARLVRDLYTDPRIAGQRRWKGVDYPAQWPAAIDLDLFERVQVHLEQLAQDHESPRRGGGPLPRSYLLSGGLAICGQPDCGQPLVPHAMKGKRTYRCESGARSRGCGRLRRLADPVEDFVGAAVRAAFNDPELGPQLRVKLKAKAAGNGVRALLNERETLRAKLHGLENDYFDGILDSEQFARGQARVKQRRAAVEAAITAATPKRLPVEIPEGIDALRDAWDHWTMEERRAVVAFALKRVIIKPTGGGYRFDGRRDLELTWNL